MTDHEKQTCIQYNSDSTRAAIDSNRDYFKKSAERYLRELEGLTDDPRKFMDRVGWMVANLTDIAFNVAYDEGHMSGIEFVTGLDEI